MENSSHIFVWIIIFDAYFVFILDIHPSSPIVDWTNALLSKIHTFVEIVVKAMAIADIPLTLYWICAESISDWFELHFLICIYAEDNIFSVFLFYFFYLFDHLSKNRMNHCTIHCTYYYELTKIRKKIYKNDIHVFHETQNTVRAAQEISQSKIIPWKRFRLGESALIDL